MPHGRIFQLAGASDVPGQGRVRHRRALYVYIGSVPFEVLYTHYGESWAVIVDDIRVRPNVISVY